MMYMHWEEGGEGMVKVERDEGKKNREDGGVGWGGRGGMERGRGR